MSQVSLLKNDMLQKTQYDKFEEDKEAEAKNNEKRLTKYLIVMFFICWFAWVAVHAQREFWAMSKKTILEDSPALGAQFFGKIDTSLFLTYAGCQFVTGMIGDRVDRRKVLGVSYSIQAVLFGLLALLGMQTFKASFAASSEILSAQAYKESLIRFILIFAGIGLV